MLLILLKKDSHKGVKGLWRAKEIEENRKTLLYENRENV